MRRNPKIVSLGPGAAYAAAGVTPNSAAIVRRDRLAEKLKPILGSALAHEVASNYVQAMMDEPVDDPTVLEEFLRQRQRHPAVYRADHLTDDKIAEARRVLVRNAADIDLTRKVWRSLGEPQVNMTELAEGISVEMEHTGDPYLAGGVALDHLREFPDYYTRLTKMEARAKAGLAPNARHEDAQSLAQAQRAFDECFDVVEARFPDFGECELHEDGRAGSDNGAGSERQFGYCKDGQPIIIAFAAKVEQLPEHNVRGLMRHEFGHALDFRYGRRPLEKLLGVNLSPMTERRADQIAEAVFGEPIEYDQRLIQCVDCGGVSPRPRRLPR